MRKYLIVAAIVAGTATGAQAAQIADGTGSISIFTAPTVSIGATTGTFGVPTGSLFFPANNAGVVATTGSFSTGLGNFTGSLTFSETVGTTLAESLTNFFSWNGFSFSVDSVETTAYTITSASGVAGLYLLGSLSKAGFDATPASLTLTVNKTGPSLYSGSASLSIPPAAPSVPEVATWAMMLVGFGAMGAAMRRRNVNVTFA